jgi:carbohydrate-binding DOMON domain-containing protein
MNVSRARVRTLEKLYAQGQASDVMDLALEKLLTYELGETQQKLDRMELDLTEFERRYEPSSEAFYARFQAREMGDATDLME